MTEDRLNVAIHARKMRRECMPCRVRSEPPPHPALEVRLRPGGDHVGCGPSALGPTHRTCRDEAATRPSAADTAEAAGARSTQPVNARGRPLGFPGDPLVARRGDMCVSLREYGDAAAERA